MSVRFENAQELSAYFEQLKETIHDEERRTILAAKQLPKTLMRSAPTKLPARL